MIGDAITRLRALLRLGERRKRTQLGLGDRRNQADAEERAKAELERLAWIKWKGGSRDEETNTEER